MPNNEKTNILEYINGIIVKSATRLSPFFLFGFILYTAYLLLLPGSKMYMDYYLGTLTLSVFAALILSIQIYKTNPELSKNIFSKTLAIILFAGALVGVTVSLLYPEILIISKKKVMEAQILLAVTTAGMMGGLVNYIAAKGLTNKEINVWSLLQNCIIGIFVSGVLFFVLRAGIITQPKVNTFNLYGVTGVSAITGFFSERMLERISGLYNELVGSGKPNE